MVSITGNMFFTVAFIFIGPLPLLSYLQPTKIMIQGSAVILGLGYTMVMVSEFGRSQLAVIKNGFNKDLDTNMLISSKLHFFRILNHPWVDFIKQFTP
jgi:hypothetical protein